jgi:proteasome activator subunit 4
VLQLWEYLLIDRFGSKNCYEDHWKNFRMVKKVLEDKLVGRKRHLRAVLIDRAMLQHESLLERGSMCLTPTHRQIMLNLLTLSTSRYSEVSLPRVCWSKATLPQDCDRSSWSYLSCCRCALGPR